jgi:hypothetical protein
MEAELAVWRILCESHSALIAFASRIEMIALGDR